MVYQSFSGLASFPFIFLTAVVPKEFVVWNGTAFQRPDALFITQSAMLKGTQITHPNQGR